MLRTAAAVSSGHTGAGSFRDTDIIPTLTLTSDLGWAVEQSSVSNCGYSGKIWPQNFSTSRYAIDVFMLHHFPYYFAANGPRRCLQRPLLCGLEVTSRSWSSLWIVTSVMAPLGRIQASSPDTMRSSNKSANSGHVVQRNSSEDETHCIVTRHDNSFQNVSLRELSTEVITALKATFLLTIAGITIPSRQSPLQLGHTHKTG